MFLAQFVITPAKFSNKFPAHVNVKCLMILFLLFGDVALNPDPINFGFVNCRSIRNKGLLIADTIVSNNLDILALAEIHIQNADTNSISTEINNFTWFSTHS